MADTVYEYGGGLYINLTNKCPCSCTFCIRSQKEGLGTADSLWLEQDPTPAEVIAALGEFPLEQYPQVVFCGYGEPLCALDTLVEVAGYLHKSGVKRVRVNTNGLGDIINQKPTAPILGKAVDAVSVSLNASNAASYCALSRPSYGLPAYDAVLAYLSECKKYVADVTASVVDVIPPEEIEECRSITDRLGIPLRVRHFTET